MTTLRTLLSPEKPDKSEASPPHLDRVTPIAAMPGGDVDVHGTHLEPLGHHIPRATIGDIPAPVILSRPTRATIRVPEGAISGDLVLASQRPPPAIRSTSASPSPWPKTFTPSPTPQSTPTATSTPPSPDPAVRPVPVSIFQIQRDFQIRPFVRDLLNATGLAFGPDGYLYASSRAEGTVYRISPEGAVSTYAEGMGIATGIAFDRDGNLFVGDRSGTIFKIGRANSDAPAAPRSGRDLRLRHPRTLHRRLSPRLQRRRNPLRHRPHHLSNQAIHAIDRDGNTTVFYQGLGRAQGMAFDVDDNLYVAASLHGQRGIIRITRDREATLAVSGNNLVGLAFLEDGAPPCYPRRPRHP